MLHKRGRYRQRSDAEKRAREAPRQTSSAIALGNHIDMDDFLLREAIRIAMRKDAIASQHGPVRVLLKDGRPVEPSGLVGGNPSKVKPSVRTQRTHQRARMASNRVPKATRKGYTLEQCEAILRENPKGCDRLLAIALGLPLKKKQKTRLIVLKTTNEIPTHRVPAQLRSA